MRLTPPRFLRHITPWKVLEWLDKRLNTCWANMVMWKMADEAPAGWSPGDGWWPQSYCWSGPEEEQFDYCGKYQTREEFETALGEVKP